MIVFRHELKAFLERNLEEVFPTCTACGCVVAKFVQEQHPNFIGTVAAKRIREYKADSGIEMTDNPPWLTAFIVKVDSVGYVREQYNMTNTISGAEALEVLTACPEDLAIQRSSMPNCA